MQFSTMKRMRAVEKVGLHAYSHCQTFFIVETDIYYETHGFEVVVSR